MSKANSKAFKKIFDYYTSVTGNSLIEGIGNGRFQYLATDGADKEWLQETKIIAEEQLSPLMTGVKAIFKGKEFIAVWGTRFDFTNGDWDILKPIELNAGILTVLLSETSLTILQDFNRIEFEDKITYQHLATFYDGYDYKDWLEFLPEINFYEIPKNSVLLDQDIFRIVCYLLLIDSKRIPLKFTTGTIDAFIKMVLESEGPIAFENVFNSLTSVNWKHSFLELYRCIERLYPIKYLKQLHSDLGLAINVVQLAEKIESATSWKPNEDLALKKLLEDSPAAILSSYNSYLATTTEDKDTLPGTYIYKLRNEIVHFRSGIGRFNLTGQQWDELIRLEVAIIAHFYFAYKNDII